MANQTPGELAAAIKTRATELGFDLVGITGAQPSAFAEEYREWLERGYAGEMEYLKRNLERRLDPRELLPGARSIIVVALNYYADAEEGPGTPKPDPKRAIFARYARGDDYHDVISARLRRLLGYLRDLAGPGADGRVYVDAGPILEREVARSAGIGWFGKNTLLINTRRGSYFFLGEIVTNVLLEPDEPSAGGCGTCTRCIDACPTKAIVEPYQVDSRRCISYLTIELKGPIPEEHADALSKSGNRIYGCDICQEVCPFNRDRSGSTDAPATHAHNSAVIHGSSPTSEPAFQPRDVTANAKLTDMLYMTQEEFSAKFKGSPVKRAKRRGLLRNAAAALSTQNNEEAIAALVYAHHDPETLVKEQAQRSLEVIRARSQKLRSNEDQ